MKKVSVEKIIQGRRASNLVMSFFIFIMICIFIGLSFYEFKSKKVMQHIINSDFKASQLLGRIMQLEEEVAMSLRMLIVTKDKKWEEHYNLYWPLLKIKIEQTNALENSLEYPHTIPINIDSATDKINAMQTQAFAFYKQGNLDAAKQIVFGNDYSVQRHKYLDTMIQYNKILHAEAIFHLHEKIQTTRYIFLTLLASLILLFIIWFYTYKSIVRFKKIKGYEQRLEELLYYDQLSEILNPMTTNLKLLQPLNAGEFNVFANELEHALEKKQFILHYQPIIRTTDHHIVGVEALLRWQHPTQGLLYPDDFLTECENNGLIISIGTWVLQTACSQARKWHDMGYSKLDICINLSARQLNDPGLLELIRETLDISKIEPENLKLEITESMIMQNIEANILLLRSLRNLGVQLSLDDFGTGYSSLSYLKQFPFTVLKIDKSFVADITTNIATLAIVEAIIALGKSLGLMLTAEGVENKNQLHMLHNLKCDLVQGFLYSKPISAEEFTQYLLKYEHTCFHEHQDSILENPQYYRFEVLKKEHYDQVVHVITKTFCDYEPMTKYLGITAHEFTPFAKIMVEKAIKDRLSMVALNGWKVCACTIVEDVADPLNVTIDIDPRFRNIFSLLEQLSKDFFSVRDFGKGHVAHLFITAVDVNYHGTGLSRKINFESIKLANEKGFDFMCCEFTHYFNEKGTVKNIKNNKLLIRSLNYKDFVFEGGKPFENLEGFASAYIWELREGAKLRYRMKPEISDTAANPA